MRDYVPVIYYSKGIGLLFIVLSLWICDNEVLYKKNQQLVTHYILIINWIVLKKRMEMGTTHNVFDLNLIELHIR